MKRIFCNRFVIGLLNYISICNSFQNYCIFRNHEYNNTCNRDLKKQKGETKENLISIK